MRLEDRRAGIDESLARLIDRLANRLGALAESHLPERAQIRTAPATPPERPERVPLPRRPLTLFDRPEAIEVVAEVSEGPPLTFRWRRVMRRVARAGGPERICPEWWTDFSGTERLRDYYEVEDDRGRRYWLYRKGRYGEPGRAPVWRVHGLFA